VGASSNENHFVLSNTKYRDHSAGCADFAKEKPTAPIYGQDKARIPQLTNEVSDEHEIKWGDIQIKCFSTPG
jgi:glyoxylase-like metal-dependent hydrolase (beta-lactamase superfamily II)